MPDKTSVHESAVDGWEFAFDLTFGKTTVVRNERNVSNTAEWSPETTASTFMLCISRQAYAKQVAT